VGKDALFIYMLLPKHQLPVSGGGCGCGCVQMHNALACVAAVIFYSVLLLRSRHGGEMAAPHGRRLSSG
jgi:hypothetical protein